MCLKEYAGHRTTRTPSLPAPKGSKILKKSILRAKIASIFIAKKSTCCTKGDRAELFNSIWV